MSNVWRLDHLSFTSPQYLVLLLLVPLLVGFVYLVQRRRSRYAVSYTNLGTLRGVATERRQWLRYVPALLLTLALLAAILAVARPRIQLDASTHSSTIVLAVDVSGSMQAGDVFPTRMTAAVGAMQTFLDSLPKDDKVGLVTFSDRVVVVNQPTTNRAALRSSLDVLTPETGTALGNGVQTAVKLVVESLAADGIGHTIGEFLPGAVVLESDGEQNRGDISPFAAAQYAKGAGVRIFGVALGTKHGKISEGSGLLVQTFKVPPDPGTVSELTRESGGQAFNATTASELNHIYRDLGSTVNRRNRSTEITWWFDGAAAVLLVAGVAAARVRGAALP